MSVIHFVNEADVQEYPVKQAVYVSLTGREDVSLRERFSQAVDKAGVFGVTLLVQEVSGHKLNEEQSEVKGCFLYMSQSVGSNDGITQDQAKEIRRNLSGQDNERISFGKLAEVGSRSVFVYDDGCQIG